MNYFCSVLVNEWISTFLGNFQDDRNSIQRTNGNDTSLNDDEYDEVENFQCVHCGKSFRKKFMLSVHVKRHLSKLNNEHTTLSRSHVITTI